jgi:hypothetical protein
MQTLQTLPEKFSESELRDSDSAASVFGAILSLLDIY